MPWRSTREPRSDCRSFASWSRFSPNTKKEPTLRTTRGWMLCPGSTLMESPWPVRPQTKYMALFLILAIQFLTHFFLMPFWQRLASTAFLRMLAGWRPSNATPLPNFMLPLAKDICPWVPKSSTVKKLSSGPTMWRSPDLKKSGSPEEPRRLRPWPIWYVVLLFI